MFEVLLNEPQLRCLGMSNYVLSEDTRFQIRYILEKNTAIERQRIDDAIWCIEASCGSALILEASSNPGEVRDELVALRLSIVRMLRKIRALSLDSKLMLDDCDNEEDDMSNRQLKNFPISAVKGEGLHKLRTYAEATEKAAGDALSSVTVRRGPRPNFNARSVALHLRETLEDFGIPVTSYESGPYMEVLRLVFSKLIPTEKDESYWRHGKWAISVKDLSEVDLASMTVGSQD